MLEKGEASCLHLWVSGKSSSRKRCKLREEGCGDSPDGNGRRCGRNLEVPERGKERGWGSPVLTDPMVTQRG